MAAHAAQSAESAGLCAHLDSVPSYTVLLPGPPEESAAASPKPPAPMAKGPDPSGAVSK